MDSSVIPNVMDQLIKLYSERVKKPEVDPENKCWEWTGILGRDKRGRVAASYYVDGVRRKKYMSANRIAWILAHNEDPKENGIIAVCGSVACQNPKHLKKFSHRDSMKEMKKGGKHHLGSKHGRAVLSESDIIRIRKLYNTGLLSYRDIQKLYPVSMSLVGFIVKGVVWSHLPFFEKVNFVESTTKPTGNFSTGKRSKARKFSDQQALNIRQRYNSGENSAVLAKEYKTSINTIIWIAKGKTYCDI